METIEAQIERTSLRATSLRHTITRLEAELESARDEIKILHEEEHHLRVIARRQQDAKEAAERKAKREATKARKEAEAQRLLAICDEVRNSR